MGRKRVENRGLEQKVVDRKTDPNADTERWARELLMLLLLFYFELQ